MHSLPVWIAFNAFVLAMLALDLGVFHRKAHSVSFREAGIWSAVWIALALAFGAGLWHFEGKEPALQYLTGYLIEKSLSVDNIFVIALIFTYFAVPAAHQHRVLFWGILGALLMRGALIGAGAFLLAKFHFLVWVFGAFLVVTGVKMALHDNAELHPEKNPLVRLARKIFRVTNDYEGQSFFVRRDGALWATPLFLVLLVVESMDLVFAVDSVPAIFAVTSDPFLVYTSNVFAILGLRSLYFLLAGIMGRFVYLKLGLSVILVFVGLKMALVQLVKVPVGISLGVIGLVLAASVAASLLKTRSAPPKEASS
jgi:tellurite resistance protein TerC